MQFTCILVVAFLTLLVCVSAGADYYKVLGIGRKATSSEIKKAYRKLRSARCHSYGHSRAVINLALLVIFLTVFLLQSQVPPRQKPFCRSFREIRGDSQRV